MELKLNIYKNSKEIEKTYITDECNILFGTCENIIALMDFEFLEDHQNDEIDSNTKLILGVTKIVKGSINEIKNLLKEIFPELTDDELRRTKINEIVSLVVDIVKFTFNGITNVSKKK